MMLFVDGECLSPLAYFPYRNSTDSKPRGHMYLVAKAPAELQPLGSAGLQGETSAGERNKTEFSHLF